jgi:hypothetical protein
MSKPVLHPGVKESTMRQRNSRRCKWWKKETEEVFPHMTLVGMTLVEVLPQGLLHVGEKEKACVITTTRRRT